MATAVEEPTSRPLWLSPAQARELVTEFLLSARYAEPTIVDWLRQGRVRWRWVRVVGQPRQGRTREQEAAELWVSGFHSVFLDWDEAFARKPTIVDRSGRTVGYVVVIGIRLSRDDLLRCLPLARGALAQTLDAATVSASGTVSPATEPGNEIEISDEVPGPRPRKRVESLPRQRTKAILRDLYPNGLPSNNEVSEADLVTTVERAWDVGPNPQLVRKPSPWTIKRVIAELRAPPSPQ